MENQDLVSTTTLARHLGVTRKTINEWRNLPEPLPVHSRKGNRLFFDVPTVLQWWLEYQIGLRIGTDTDGREVLDLAQERAALARSQRERVDLQLAQARGALISIEQLGDALTSEYTILRSAAEAIVPEMRRVCPHLGSRDFDQMRKIIAKILNRLADCDDLPKIA